MTINTKGITAVSVICALVLLSGCALRGKTAGNGSLDLPQDGGAAASLSDHIARVRLSAGPVAKSSALPSVEKQDAELSAALLRLAVAETAEQHRVVAERYRLLRVPDLAAQHFTRAIEMNPRDAAAHDGRARVWRDWGFPHLALGDAHRAVFFAPSSAAAHNTMGTILQALGQLDPAKKAYGRAAALDSAAVYALSNLCYLEFLGGDFNGARTTCRSALAVTPEFAAARNNLALAHAGAGQLDLARNEFMAAGDEAVGYFNIGVVHMAVRDYAQAATAFDAASRRDPRMSVARERATQARLLGRSAARGAIGDPK